MKMTISIQFDLSECFLEDGRLSFSIHTCEPKDIRYLALFDDYGDVNIDVIDELGDLIKAKNFPFYSDAVTIYSLSRFSGIQGIMKDFHN